MGRQKAKTKKERKTIMSGDENRLVINLSYECLKKVANDPEFAKEMEEL